MKARRRVLLVTPTTPLSKTLSRSARHAGYDVTIAKTFQAARSLLSAPPDLLITELKLGEYNGLQLAVRLAATGVPAIVVADKTYEHEVEQVGAVWLTSDTSAADDLPAAMARLVQGAGSTHDVYPWYDAQDGESPTPVSPAGPTDTASRIPH